MSKVELRADRLRALRKNKGLRITQVIEVLELPRSSYTNWEQGHRQPSLTMLKKLAELYETSTDYLLGLTNNPGPSAPIDPDYLEQLKQNTFDGVLLTEEQAKQGIAVLKALFDRK